MYMHFFRSADTVGEKSNPLLRALLLSADIMKGTSLNNHLLSSSIRETTKRCKRFPASQILLGSREQDWEMLRLRWKLSTCCISFCGHYSANIRRGMKETIRLPSVWFSDNVHSNNDSCSRRWVWGGLPEKRIKEDYLTTTAVLADCRQKKGSCIFV